jgi:2-polyprenyl-3-methyl-5-hydroxy-6-metoxy-1,4-benzoquinol methylase
MKFSKRIHQQEIMDNNSIPITSLASAYRDINRSNRMLGGYSATYKALTRLEKMRSRQEPIRLLDLGCGDGGMLRYLAKRYRKLELPIELIGIDLNPNTIALARKSSTEFPEIEYNIADILKPEHVLTPYYDYVLCTLTLHHFNDQEIPGILKACQQLCSRGVIINDLHRSRLAYYLFKFFSAIFIKSDIASNDGLVSIRRGFRQSELRDFSTNIPNWIHDIRWQWAFRYVWVMKNNRLRQS